MKNITWDAYQIFLSVARHGGLTAAATATGLSGATIGRRMLDFEREMECSLFIRSQSGYALTEDGNALYERLKEMEGAARKIDSWRQDYRGSVLVRISAGTWIASFLSENFSSICNATDKFRIDLFISEQRASLSHRTSDIGIRAFEPEETNLASIKVPDVAYAAYRARNSDPATHGRWVALREEDAISAYLRWPHVHGAVTATVNRPWALRDLIAAGAGMGVLPCFVGDRDPRLQRAGEEISELRHRQWIVMNNEDRHRPEIRTVVNRMTDFLKGNAGLLGGQKPWAEAAGGAG
ncbi:LysR family transcriptional regulator [Phyllobacterium sp. 628]|uniref:LysR family transcriptional regulator n=1 Tax=Phyllobacterium sp. 628 TaxID=2718938 RepID=UPI001662273B|nr:LysR family transcriptional regulator [Phyllobacterium sp. 628]QND52905.1 LysR family transcriptional regulator [Phyllobacterium sp. 628]